MKNDHKWMSRQREKQIKSAKEGQKRKEQSRVTYDYATFWDNDEVVIINSSSIAVEPKFNPEEFEKFYNEREEMVCYEWREIRGLVKRICH